MIRLIRELRRREVFRALGLYVGLCWIAIEGASIFLPAFDAPQWLLRALIIVAIVGFPIVFVLAWIYDVSEQGITLDSGQADEVVPAFGGRKMDFLVIGLLSVALVFSVYLNVSSRSVDVEELEPVSVLIADFENRVGDSVFDGLLEQALTIGIETASHVTSYERNAARNLAMQLRPDSEGLSAEDARLVAVREGIDIVLPGSIALTESGYRLELLGLDPVTGRQSFSVTADAVSRDAVLTAIGELSVAVREELGDESFRQSDVATAETFTAASIEAASAYMNGIELAFGGRLEEAVANYKIATDLDPDFGRAFSGWATAEFELGREEQATALWDKAVSLMNTMTERERLRTLGLYYIAVTRNYAEAVETFAELVKKYPADAAGYNNLAVAAFMTLDFDRASAEGTRILEIYPNSPLYRANSALYAMYSGDFNGAAIQARAMIEDDPEYGTAYLPLALSLLATEDAGGARQAFQQMRRATTSPHRESAAILGLADTSVYQGAFQQARDLLTEGIESDIADGARAAAAVKHIALAETYVESGDYMMAVGSANDALELSRRDSIMIASAIIFAASQELESAATIAEDLIEQLPPQSRAYGMMIQAVILRRSGEYVEAIDRLRAAIELADLWRVRFELGRAYLDAGFFVEAFDEFENCLDRRGEATAMFLDDTPTFRYLAELSYWLARAQDGLGMQADAIENYRAYLALRPQGGARVDDSRQRLP